MASRGVAKEFDVDLRRGSRGTGSSRDGDLDRYPALLMSSEKTYGVCGGDAMEKVYEFEPAVAHGGDCPHHVLHRVHHNNSGYLHPLQNHHHQMAPPPFGDYGAATTTAAAAERAACMAENCENLRTAASAGSSSEMLDGLVDDYSNQRSSSEYLEGGGGGGGGGGVDDVDDVEGRSIGSCSADLLQSAVLQAAAGTRCAACNHHHLLHYHGNHIVGGRGSHPQLQQHYSATSSSNGSLLSYEIPLPYNNGGSRTSAKVVKTIGGGYHNITASAVQTSGGGGANGSPYRVCSDVPPLDMECRVTLQQQIDVDRPLVDIGTDESIVPQLNND